MRAIRLRALWLLLGLILGAAGAAYAVLHKSEPDWPDVGPILIAHGYKPGDYVTEPVPEAPPHSHPFGHMEGHVTFPPAVSAPGSITGAGGQSPPPPGPTPAPCDLGALTLDVNCAFDAFTEGVPWGRLVVSATITGYGQRRFLPETEAQELDFRVAKTAKPAPRLRWLVEARGLVLGPDPGLRAGITWYRTGHRVGLAVDYDRTWRDVTLPGACYVYYCDPSTTHRGSVGAVGIGAAIRLP